MSENERRHNHTNAAPRAGDPAAWLTSRDAAAVVGVSDQTIRAWCARGYVPGAFQFPPGPGGWWHVPAATDWAAVRARVQGVGRPKSVDNNES